MITRLKLRLKFKLLHLRMIYHHRRLLFVEWLGTQFFNLSQFCTHVTIGKSVLKAYRERTPNAAELILERHKFLSSISCNFCALDMLGSMYRQVTKPTTKN